MKDEKKSIQEKGRRENSIVQTWIKSIYLRAGYICAYQSCVHQGTHLSPTLFLVREAVSSNPVTEALQVHTGVHCSVQ